MQKLLGVPISTGLTIQVDLSEIKAQIEAGAITWDIIDVFAL